jgi:hypothetical protein
VTSFGKLVAAFRKSANPPPPPRRRKIFRSLWLQEIIMFARCSHNRVERAQGPIITQALMPWSRVQKKVWLFSPCHLLRLVRHTILVSCAFMIGRAVGITSHTSRCYWWLGPEHVNTNMSIWRYPEWRHLLPRVLVRVAASDPATIYRSTRAPRLGCQSPQQYCYEWEGNRCCCAFHAGQHERTQ